MTNFLQKEQSSLNGFWADVALDRHLQRARVSVGDRRQIPSEVLGSILTLAMPHVLHIPRPSVSEALLPEGPSACPPEVIAFAFSDSASHFA